MKYSVLTYIFNDYDLLKEVCNPDAECEYVVVTDDPDMKSETWKVIYDEKLKDLSPFDKTFYVRYHPFEYVTNDIVIKMDGSIKVKNGIGLQSIINKFENEKYDIGAIPHPLISSLIQEYYCWINNRSYPKEQAEKQLMFLQRFGYNLKLNGFLQLMFVIERIHNKELKIINDLTYSSIKYLGDETSPDRLDQPIFNCFVLRFLNKIKILTLNFSSLFGDNIHWCKHGTDEELTILYDAKTRGNKVLLYNNSHIMASF